ncbi:MAG: hypothetical protein BWY83_02149 [bacterium ADurb.Bin478]|nr:MAG: hypothetical protein BWY83_02149 [bacterium ADurb.Bin478]
MQRRGRQLFAGSALAEDEHRKVGVGDLVDEFGDILQPGGLPHNHLAGRQIGLELLQRRLRRLFIDLLQQFLDLRQQVFHDDRLEYVLIGALFDGLYRVMDGAVPGKHEHIDVRFDPFDLLQQIHAGNAGHAHVRDDDVDVVVGDDVDGFGGVVGGGAFDVLQFEHVLQNPQTVFFIIYKQDSVFFMHHVFFRILGFYQPDR